MEKVQPTGRVGAGWWWWGGRRSGGAGTGAGGGGRGEEGGGGGGEEGERGEGERGCGAVGCGCVGVGWVGVGVWVYVGVCVWVCVGVCCGVWSVVCRVSCVVCGVWFGVVWCGSCAKKLCCDAIAFRARRAAQRHSITPDLGPSSRLPTSSSSTRASIHEGYASSTETGTGNDVRRPEHHQDQEDRNRSS